MTELEIATYLDRALSSSDRDWIEDHLAECTECRGNVAEAQQLIDRMKRPRRAVALGSLVALAAAAVFIIRPQITSDKGLVMRDAPAGSSSLAAYGPVGAVPERPERFVWSPTKDAVSYRITLSVPDGSTLWTWTGTDTTAALPDSVNLRAGEPYIWFGDALMRDGSTRSTGLKEFTLRR